MGVRISLDAYVIYERTNIRLLATILLIFALVPVASAGNKNGKYKMRVLRTAYCLKGYTWSGRYVHPGSIAVDPNVIRIGTNIYVPGYGHGRAEDTGKAIKGRHIDVWVSDCSKARRIGSSYVIITVF